MGGILFQAYETFSCYFWVCVLFLTHPCVHISCMGRCENGTQMGVYSVKQMNAHAQQMYESWTDSSWVCFMHKKVCKLQLGLFWADTCECACVYFTQNIVCFIQMYKITYKSQLCIAASNKERRMQRTAGGHMVLTWSKLRCSEGTVFMISR